MKREEKNKLIDSLANELSQENVIYIADISDLNAASANNLRRLCFKQNVRLRMVKNTLLKLAMEKSDKDLEPLYEVLKGSSSLMYGESGNSPARLIREFRKKSDKPVLKGAYVEEMIYIGDDQLTMLEQIKSKNELIADVIALLQSPAKKVISALQSGGQQLSGILETLSEKE
ncbi:MAG: 50S ribosomal protein L10 [Bacteroidales bacterium]|nr:50S ribosomal protein L10 [Bacteroidales bacterium]